MQKVCTKEITIKAKDWPAFLYDPNIQYDPHNKDVGLLRGPVFMRVSRYILSRVLGLDIFRSYAISSLALLAQ